MLGTQDGATALRSTTSQDPPARDIGELSHFSCGRAVRSARIGLKKIDGCSLRLSIEDDLAAEKSLLEEA